MVSHSTTPKRRMSASDTETCPMCTGVDSVAATQSVNGDSSIICSSVKAAHISAATQ